MKTSSNNNFEQQWKRKFDNTSISPPDNLWDKIEADLDVQKKRSPFFLVWGLPAYVTSGIAATLILALGGWYLFNISETNPAVEVVEIVKPTESEPRKTHSVVTRQEEAEVSGYAKVEVISSYVKPKVIAEQVNSYSSPRQISEKNDFRQPMNSFQTTLISEQVVAQSKNRNSTSLFENVAIQLKKLTARPYEEYPVRYILSRNKLAYNEPIIDAPIEKKHRSWIGLISGLSPFKPNFQNGGLNQLASANVASFSSNDANFTVQRAPQGAQGSVGSNAENAFVIPTASPVQQFANGRAFNLGIQAGRQLTERLALESGVRYIQGNSPVNTNVYTLNERTGEVNPFVQDYLTQDKTLANAVVAPSEVIQNSYEYVSIPLQLAYEIPLHKKVNIEITGGVSADMFLQNTLQSETTDIASLNASNSAFRTLGVSGLGGVRLNYLLDEKWELTIGSALQQALVSNFESGTSAKLRPQMLGINYGVNYNF